MRLNPPTSVRSVWKTKRDGKELHGLGNREILTQRALGLICSVQCPGSVVIKTFDAIRELRDAGVAVVGGFHSPMEMQCLEFLLRGEQPVIVVLAKGMTRPRLPEPWRTAITAGHMLLVSPFRDNVRRTTKAHAQIRNEFVATFAASVLIPHGSPGGKAEMIAQSILHQDQRLFTFEDDENKNLFQIGARPYVRDEIIRLLTAPMRARTSR